MEAKPTYSAKTPVHIGRIIRDARFFNGRNNDPMDSESLFQTVEKLFDYLEKKVVDFVLVGGIALLQYVEGRNTEDIDLIMAVHDFKKLSEFEVGEQDDNFARATFHSLQIDLLLTANPVFAHVQKHHTHSQTFKERPIPTATIEGLILLKLYALPSLYRQGNFAKVGLYENDIATLLFYHRPKMPEILQELKPFVNAADFGEIESIVADIHKRLDRFGGNGE